MNREPYTNMTIDKLEDLYHELKVRKDKGIGGQGIKDIKFRRYVKLLIDKKKRTHNDN